MAAAGEPGWRKLSAPHYELYSQLGDRETTAWAREFDQFIASMSDVLQLDAQLLPPLTVVLFARDRDFTPYKLARPDGQVANVDGQFLRRPTWSVIGMVENRDDAAQREVLYHEATHWLLSIDEARQPAWFSEGIAELLSTFEYRGERIHWAKPLAWRLATLRSEPLMPLREFLAQPGAIFDRDEHTDLFYAQAWAFTHFLLYSGEGSRSALLRRFLVEFREKSGSAAVDDIFGARLPQLEMEFAQYVQQRSWRFTSQPGKPVPPPPPLQGAAPAEVEVALAHLALGADRYELARQHAARAMTLDAEAPGGHEILAYIAFDAERDEEAALHAAAALERGSNDSDMFVLRGTVMQSDPEQVRMLADLYQRAIETSPRRALLYQLLASALMGVDSPTDEDAALLARGLAAFPGEDWLKVGMASVERGLGRETAAMETLQDTLRADSTLDAGQREVALSLQRNWHMEALGRAVRAAMDRRDFAEAQAALEWHGEYAAGDARAERYVASLRDLVRRMQGNGRR